MSPRKEPQNFQSKDPQNGKDIKEPQNGQEEEQADILTDTGLPRIFLSSKWHSSTTLEYLSKRWGLSLAQATLTLKATTQKLVRSAVMPLTRRYRADHIIDVSKYMV